MRDKIHSYLGFAKRSQSLISGYYSCIDGMKRKNICLLILTEDLAENTASKLYKLATSQGIPVRVYGTKDMISGMTGVNNRGIFGVVNENLAVAILQEIDREEQNA
ncbi:MAG: ribosomal L7Ae/L30e/S12e/Gadd45 family protein [Eubacteriales bacterium]|nr:ribosomal L7Ae/L30e/S12e/Gadd45 family protein [Eubacteriales bacterium]MDD4582683.1 ribosomal L7Ae/L30e/S12e/Gadd45 family protein [Eubacteriales bacterium]